MASLISTNSPTFPSDVLFSTQISSAGAIPGVTAVDTGGIPGGNSIPGGGGMFPMGGGRKGGRWGKREEANEESYQAIQNTSEIQRPWGNNSTHIIMRFSFHSYSESNRYGVINASEDYSLQNQFPSTLRSTGPLPDGRTTGRYTF